MGKGLRTQRLVLKQCLAQELENGILGLLWREINPECGNNFKCSIISHEIDSMGVAGLRGRKPTNTQARNPFPFILKFSNVNAPEDFKFF